MACSQRKEWLGRIGRMVGYEDPLALLTWSAVSIGMLGFVLVRAPLIIPSEWKANLAPGEDFKMQEEYSDGAKSTGISLTVHVTSIALWTICGTFQFIPRLRKQYPFYHRVSGRIYFLASVVVLITGFLLTPSAFGGDFSVRSASWTIGLTFAGTGLMGLLRGLQRRIQEHKRWMLRMYAAGASVALSRIMVPLGGLVLVPPLGLWGTMSCAQIRYELHSEPADLAEYFPMCMAVAGRPAPSQVVAVKAGTESEVHMIVGMRMAFSVGLWWGLLLNMALVEAWIRWFEGAAVGGPLPTDLKDPLLVQPPPTTQEDLPRTGGA